MFASKAILSLLLIALSAVDASPLRRNANTATLSFAARLNAKGAANIAAADKARAQMLKQAGAKSKRAGSSSVSIPNAVVNYVAQVGVGNPATECKIGRQM